MTTTRHRGHHVLSLYKQILKLAKNWESKTGDTVVTQTESTYIKNEASTLFRRNKNLVQENEIQLRIQEAEARIALAIHYKNPYPRPVNVPPKTYVNVEGRHRRKAQDERLKKSTPVYVKSQTDE